MKYTPSQERAIFESGKNILVSAGAGSGKTGVLRQRVIERLKSGLHIDELMILTFTNAAAFEMKSRIIDAIHENKQLLDELKRMDQAIISTFDAYCLRLVKEYHYLLDLPSQVVIGDKIQVLTMEKQVLDNVIEGYYKQNDPDFETLVKRLFQKGDSILYETIQQFSHKIRKIPECLQMLDNFEGYYSKELLECYFEEFSDQLFASKSQTIPLLQQYLMDLEPYTSKSIDTYKQSMQQIKQKLEQITSIDELIHVYRTINVPNKPGGKKDEILQEILNQYHQTIKDAVISIQEPLDEGYIIDKESAISSILETKSTVMKIVEITRTYLTELQNAKRKHNLYDYSDIMDFATMLLENNTDIVQNLKTHIKEIMVDEYQDTNDLQDYFISLIADNNLFMVGDIKQSIYGFRDANPENFLRKYLDYSQGIDGIAIDLRENFRSRKQVIEDINHTFEDVMDTEIGGINYKDHQSLVYGLKAYDVEADYQHYGVDLIQYDFEAYKEEDEYASKPKTEANLLAKDIASRISKKQQVFDTQFRDIEYKDIAILVDRKTDFAVYSEVLSSYNIPVHLYSDEPFMDSPEILFLMSYLKWIKCFLDEEYLLANYKKVLFSIARSFVFQIKDDVIIDFLTSEPIQSVFDLERMLQIPEFVSLYHTTKELSKFVDSMSIYELVIQVYQKLQMFQAISFLDNPREKEEKLDYFAANIQSFTGFHFDDLITYLETIEEHKDWDIEYSKNRTNANAVSLMTMHKAKGLQFPVVYCPGLSKKFNFMENKDFFMYDKKYGLITSAFDHGFYPTFLRKLSLDRSKKEYISERIRLLYVAFTRAKEHLVLFSDKSSIKPDMRKLDNSSYIEANIRLSYNQFTDVISSTTLANYDYYFEPLDHVQNNIIPYTPNTSQTIEHKTFDYNKMVVSDKTYSKPMVELLSDDVISAIQYGTTVHRLLEAFDFNHVEESLKMLPTKVATSMETLLKSTIFQHASNPNIYQEFEFYETTDSGVKHGIIDLLVRYQDRIYIVDYKLKNISSEAYKTQLKGYFDYMHSKTELPIELYLYSILDETLVKVL